MRYTILLLTATWLTGAAVGKADEPVAYPQPAPVAYNDCCAKPCGHGIFGMFLSKSCCAPKCCKPVCHKPICCPKPRCCKPKCCKPVCCPKPRCCKPKCCKPVCCPKPRCCKPVCNTCCKPSLIDRIKAKFAHRCNSCCDSHYGATIIENGTDAEPIQEMPKSDDEVVDGDTDEAISSLEWGEIQ